MKTFEAISLDLTTVTKELDELEAFLAAGTALKERAEITPFFASRKHLSTAIGYFNSSIELPDRIAFELDLFGDFTCDLASGDSARNAYILVEFEDASGSSIFQRLEKGKTMKRWSTRFEHGFSQLVDWAWRLSGEATSDAYGRIFGARHASIHLLLVTGRDSGLTSDDLARLEWRAKNSLSGRIQDVMPYIRWRPEFIAAAPPLAGPGVSARTSPIIAVDAVCSYIDSSMGAA